MVLNRINARFRDAVPTSDLKRVGVIIHGKDAMEDPDRPWMACPKSSLACGFISDRMSSSLVYKGKTAAFSGGFGIILMPEATRLLCAYGGDGGTRGKTCSPPGMTSHCIPGCVTSGGAGEWCEPSKTNSPRDFWCDGRPWRPRDLGNFISRDKGSNSYNEMVVDGYYWNNHLPHSIEAILTIGEASTKAMHDRFLSAYKVTAQQVPLVRYVPELGDAPFVLA